MSKSLLIAVTFCFLMVFYCGGQTPPDGSDSKHERWEYVLEDTGDVLQLALPISAGIMTLVKKDYEGTKQFALSYGTTMALTYSMKYLIKKPRPEGRLNADSFPSGHTSSAFSGASFIQRRYGWKYGTYAYALAALVAISRTEAPDGHHDGWDVLAGAAVGIGSTYIFTKPYAREHFNLGFSGGRDTYVLTFKYKF